MLLQCVITTQDAAVSGNPVLLDLDFDSGHGVQETTSSIADKVVKANSFYFNLAAKKKMQ